MDLTPREDPLSGGYYIVANMRSAMRLIEDMTTILLCPEGDGERVTLAAEAVRAEYPFACFEIVESAYVPAGKVFAIKKGDQPRTVSERDRGDNPGERTDG